MRPEFVFGEKASLVTFLSHNHRHGQASRHEHGLISEIACRTCRIDQRNSACLAAVAARQDVEFDGSCLQQLAEHQDEWSFARTSYGQISDTDYRTAQPANGGDAAVVELVPRAYA